MIWIFYTTLSMVFGSLEDVFDKIIILKKPQLIDPMIGTFYRNMGFFLFTVLAGFLGIFGKMAFSFNMHYLLLALLWPLSSLSQDYFLRNVEVSRFSGFFYTFPFIFLLIDRFYFHTSYSSFQIAGTIILIFGAVLFSFDLNKKKFVLTGNGVIWLIVKMIIAVYFSVVFKLTQGSTNEVSFYFSIWLMIVSVYFILLLITRKVGQLKKVALANHFMAKTMCSKAMDFFSSVFYLKALSTATLTAVSALSSFSPMVLLLILSTVQILTGLRVQEDLNRKMLAQKILASTLLVAGGISILYL